MNSIRNMILLKFQILRNLLILVMLLLDLLLLVLSVPYLSMILLLCMKHFGSGLARV